MKTQATEKNGGRGGFIAFSFLRKRKWLSAIVALIFLLNTCCPAWAARDGNYGASDSLTSFASGALAGAVTVVSCLISPVSGAAGSVAGDLTGLFMYYNYYNTYGQALIKIGDFEISQGQFWSMIAGITASVAAGYVAGMIKGATTQAAEDAAKQGLDNAVQNAVASAGEGASKEVVDQAVKEAFKKELEEAVKKYGQEIADKAANEVIKGTSDAGIKAACQASLQQVLPTGWFQQLLSSVRTESIYVRYGAYGQFGYALLSLAGDLTVGIGKLFVTEGIKYALTNGLKKLGKSWGHEGWGLDETVASVIADLGGTLFTTFITPVIRVFLGNIFLGKGNYALTNQGAYLNAQGKGYVDAEYFIDIDNDGKAERLTASEYYALQEQGKIAADAAVVVKFKDGKTLEPQTAAEVSKNLSYANAKFTVTVHDGKTTETVTVDAKGLASLQQQGKISDTTEVTVNLGDEKIQSTVATVNQNLSYSNNATFTVTVKDDNGNATTKTVSAQEYSELLQAGKIDPNSVSVNLGEHFAKEGELNGVFKDTYVLLSMGKNPTLTVKDTAGEEHAVTLNELAAAQGKARDNGDGTYTVPIIMTDGKILMINVSAEMNERMNDFVQSLDSLTYLKAGAETGGFLNDVTGKTIDVSKGGLSAGWQALRCLGLSPLLGAGVKVTALLLLDYRTHYGSDKERIFENAWKMSLADFFGNLTAGVVNNADGLNAALSGTSDNPWKTRGDMKFGEYLGKEITTQLTLMGTQVAWAYYCKANNIDSNALTELEHMAASSVVGGLVDALFRRDPGKAQEKQVQVAEVDENGNVVGYKWVDKNSLVHDEETGKDTVNGAEVKVFTDGKDQFLADSNGKVLVKGSNGYRFVNLSDISVSDGKCTFNGSEVSVVKAGDLGNGRVLIRNKDNEIEIYTGTAASLPGGATEVSLNKPTEVIVGGLTVYSYNNTVNVSSKLTDRLYGSQLFMSGYRNKHTGQYYATKEAMLEAAEENGFKESDYEEQNFVTAGYRFTVGVGMNFVNYGIEAAAHSAVYLSPQFTPGTGMLGFLTQQQNQEALAQYISGIMQGASPIQLLANRLASNLNGFANSNLTESISAAITNPFLSPEYRSYATVITPGERARYLDYLKKQDQKEKEDLLEKLQILKESSWDLKGEKDKEEKELAGKEEEMRKAHVPDSIIESFAAGEKAKIARLDKIDEKELLGIKNAILQNAFRLGILTKNETDKSDAHILSLLPEVIAGLDAEIKSPAGAHEPRRDGFGLNELVTSGVVNYNVNRELKMNAPLSEATKEKMLEYAEYYKLSDEERENFHTALTSSRFGVDQLASDYSFSVAGVYQGRESYANVAMTEVMNNASGTRLLRSEVKENSQNNSFIAECEALKEAPESLAATRALLAQTDTDLAKLKKEREQREGESKALDDEIALSNPTNSPTGVAGLDQKIDSLKKAKQAKAIEMDALAAQISSLEAQQRDLNKIAIVQGVRENPNSQHLTPFTWLPGEGNEKKKEVEDAISEIGGGRTVYSDYGLVNRITVDRFGRAVQTEHYAPEIAGGKQRTGVKQDIVTRHYYGPFGHAVSVTTDYTQIRVPNETRQPGQAGFEKDALSGLWDTLTKRFGAEEVAALAKSLDIAADKDGFVAALQEKAKADPAIEGKLKDAVKGLAVRADEKASKQVYSEQVLGQIKKLRDAGISDSAIVKELQTQFGALIAKYGLAPTPSEQEHGLVKAEDLVSKVTEKASYSELPEFEVNVITNVPGEEKTEAKTVIADFGSLYGHPEIIDAAAQAIVSAKKNNQSFEGIVISSPDGKVKFGITEVLRKDADAELSGYLDKPENAGLLADLNRIHDLFWQGDAKREQANVAAQFDKEINAKNVLVNQAENGKQVLSTNIGQARQRQIQLEAEASVLDARIAKGEEEIRAKSGLRGFVKGIFGGKQNAGTTPEELDKLRKERSDLQGQIGEQGRIMHQSENSLGILNQNLATLTKEIADLNEHKAAAVKMEAWQNTDVTAEGLRNTPWGLTVLTMIASGKTPGGKTWDQLSDAEKVAVYGNSVVLSRFIGAGFQRAEGTEQAYADLKMKPGKESAYTTGYHHIKSPGADSVPAKEGSPGSFTAIIVPAEYGRVQSQAVVRQAPMEVKKQPVSSAEIPVPSLLPVVSPQEQPFSTGPNTSYEVSIYSSDNSHSAYAGPSARLNFSNINSGPGLQYNVQYSVRPNAAENTLNDAVYNYAVARAASNEEWVGLRKGLADFLQGLGYEKGEIEEKMGKLPKVIDATGEKDIAQLKQEASDIITGTAARSSATAYPEGAREIMRKNLAGQIQNFTAAYEKIGEERNRLSGFLHAMAVTGAPGKDEAAITAAVEARLDALTMDNFQAGNRAQIEAYGRTIDSLKAIKEQSAVIQDGAAALENMKIKLSGLISKASNDSEKAFLTDLDKQLAVAPSYDKAAANLEAALGIIGSLRTGLANGNPVAFASWAAQDIVTDPQMNIRQVLIKRQQVMETVLSQNLYNVKQSQFSVYEKVNDKTLGLPTWGLTTGYAVEKNPVYSQQKPSEPKPVNEVKAPVKNVFVLANFDYLRGRNNQVREDFGQAAIRGEGIGIPAGELGLKAVDKNEIIKIADEQIFSDPKKKKAFLEEANRLFQDLYGKPHKEKEILYATQVLKKNTQVAALEMEIANLKKSAYPQGTRGYEAQAAMMKKKEAELVSLRQERDQLQAAKDGETGYLNQLAQKRVTQESLTGTIWGLTYLGMIVKGESGADGRAGNRWAEMNPQEKLGIMSGTAAIGRLVPVELYGKEVKQDSETLKVDGGKVTAWTTSYDPVTSPGADSIKGGRFNSIYLPVLITNGKPPQEAPAEKPVPAAELTGYQYGTVPELRFSKLQDYNYNMPYIKDSIKQAVNDAYTSRNEMLYRTLTGIAYPPVAGSSRTFINEPNNNDMLGAYYNRYTTLYLPGNYKDFSLTGTISYEGRGSTDIISQADLFDK